MLTEKGSQSPTAKPGIFNHTEDVYGDDSASLDPVYAAKARLLNDALQEIGMGKYQWHLFVVTGFGWLVDNLYPVVTGLILSQVVREFKFEGPYLKLAQNIGLLLGAVAFGLGSDVWGRKLAFNVTLLIVGIFATAAGGSPNYIALCSFAAVWSIGVGGNLPVDSAIFLEFVPASHQYLLTVLSIWWAFGQLLGSLVAWPLIGNTRFSCSATAESCPKSSNMGWRYFLFTMGGLMLLLWGIRFFVFKLHESPKYLMGRGQDEKAVEIVHKVAAYNGRTSYLTLEALQSVGQGLGQEIVDASAQAALQRQLHKFSGNHVKALFATRKMAYSTSLLIILWAFIGLAFPLYNAFLTYFLDSRGAVFGDGSVYITYRNQVIISVLGVPGAIIAGFMVEVPRLGRKGTLCISTRKSVSPLFLLWYLISATLVLTGVFILASTTARTSNALLGWNCGYSLTSNVMYGTLYALSPECFATKDRGTGNALVATANRVFGIMSPIIALYADLTSSVPIFIAGALFLVSGIMALLLPFEPRGKASL